MASSSSTTTTTAITPPQQQEGILPPLLVAWIRAFLTWKQENSYLQYEAGLHRAGFDCLKVKDIKQLAMHLDRILQTDESTNNNNKCMHVKRPLHAAKKEKWVSYMNQMFFQLHPKVLQPKSELIWTIIAKDIHNLQKKHPKTTTATTTTAKPVTVTDNAVATATVTASNNTATATKSPKKDILKEKPTAASFAAAIAAATAASNDYHVAKNQKFNNYLDTKTQNHHGRPFSNTHGTVHRHKRQKAPFSPRKHALSSTITNSNNNFNPFTSSSSSSTTDNATPNFMFTSSSATMSPPSPLNPITHGWLQQPPPPPPKNHYKKKRLQYYEQQMQQQQHSSSLSQQQHSSSLSQKRYLQLLSEKKQLCELRQQHQQQQQQQLSNHKPCKINENPLTASCCICNCLNVDYETLPCGHKFHKWCFDQLTIGTNKQYCPRCHCSIQSSQCIEIPQLNTKATKISTSTTSTKQIIDLTETNSPSLLQTREQLIKSQQYPVTDENNKVTTIYPSQLASIIANETVDNIKIKQESGASVVYSSTSTGNKYDLQPKNGQEQHQVELLRQMGFTDIREMLSGLRHVEQNNNQLLDSQYKVQEAMLWIVTQREEADEARRMDEVRRRSEVIVIDEEVNKHDPLYIIQHSSIEEMLGNNNKTASKLFPLSSLLESHQVYKLFHFIFVSDHQCNNKGKCCVVQILTLEKKARQWYGSKIPHFYFHFVLKERLNDWYATQYLLSKKCQKMKQDLVVLLKTEIDALERALYILSEQEKGDLGMMVPKLFLNARGIHNKNNNNTNNVDDALNEITLIDDD